MSSVGPLLSTNYSGEDLEMWRNSSPHTQKIYEEEGPKGLQKYLDNVQPYAIVSVPATWGIRILKKGSPLHGNMGRHLCIRLPGERQCEWGSATPYETEAKEVEIRNVTGRVIENMWHKHLELSPRYNTWDSQPLSGEGFKSYCPFVNDCHSYANRILQETGQEMSKLYRWFNYSNVASTILGKEEETPVQDPIETTELTVASPVIHEKQETRVYFCDFLF